MIQTTTLPSGIRVITDSKFDAETVSLGVWVAVGARFETKELSGISHMLEHMAFKGTQTRTAAQIAAEIENVGGIMNAYTGKDVTAYYVKVLKEDKELALRLIADILQDSTMNPEELAREKGVIIQEINMQNDTPDELVFDYYAQTAYPDQPLGRPILGTTQTVSGISSEQLLHYMKTQYTTDRLVISAAGNVQHEEFVALCSALFEKISQKSSLSYEPAHYVGGEIRVLKAHEQVNLVLGFEGCAYQDPDYYAATILACILGGGMSSRLFQDVREKRGLVYSIYAHNSPELDTGSFYIYAGTGEKQAAEVYPVLCDILTGLETTLTEEEISRAKTQIKARVLMRLENISTHAESNALELIIHNRIISKEETIQKIDSVSREDLQAYVRRLLNSQPTMASLGPIDYVMSYDDLRQRLKG